MSTFEQQTQLLLNKLTVKRDKLVCDRLSHREEVTRLRERRSKNTQQCLAHYIPNTRPWTLWRLKKTFPNFYVPTRSVLFALIQIPHASSLNLIRAQLGSYLDNLTEGALPYTWYQQVGLLDDEICLKERDFRAIEHDIALVYRKIALTGKLLEILRLKKFNRVSPDSQSRVREIVGRELSFVSNPAQKPPYPLHHLNGVEDQEVPDSSRNTGTPAMVFGSWEWLGEVVSRGELQSEGNVDFSSGEGGDFGGGGASGGFDVVRTGVDNDPISHHEHDTTPLTKGIAISDSGEQQFS